MSAGAARPAPPPPRLLGAALFGGAAAYFALGRRLGVEWTDTGMVLYPSLQVAAGALPYRDFTQLFGPSLFYVNGALLWLFGDDLQVIRWWLVLLKALTVLVVFRCATLLAAWPAALGAALLVIAVWGVPWWIFNTPYANHYALTLDLAGFGLFVGLPAGLRARGLAAGLCFGAAATFKQTSGLFAAVALALAVLWVPPAGDDEPGPPSRRLDAAARAARWLVLAAVPPLFAVYLRPSASIWTVAALGGPLATLWAGLVAREGRGAVAPAGRTRSARALLWIAVGALLPLSGWAAWYAGHGALPALWFNLVSGLPQRVSWFDPYPVPPRRSALLVAAALGALWLAAAGGARRRRHTAAAIAAAAAVAVALDVVRHPVRGTSWYGDVLHALGLLPVLVAWGGLLSARRLDEASTPPASAVAPFAAFACVGLLFFQPSGDVWHLLMGLPAFLPLLAFGADRWGRIVAGSHPARPNWSAWALPAAFLAALCAPFVHALWTARAAAPGGPVLPRASGIVDPTPKFAQAADLLDHLRSLPPDQPMLVVANEPLLYVLAGRRSSLAEDEFVLYLIGFGLLAPDDRESFLPEARVLERIAADRPVIVDHDGPASARFRAAYPAVTAWIEAHYREARRAGAYRVLEPTERGGRASAPPAR